MIRVLQVVNNMHRAGLETMLMNYYRKMDREKIQFDFLTHRPERSDYDDEIECLGGKVYYAPRLYPQNYHAYFKFMDQFFKEHKEYKIIHSHIDAMSYLPLLAAKRAGVPIRIAHSHNTSIDRDFKYLMKRYFKSRIPTVANYYCACGQDAGRFLFPGKDFLVIPNAVDAGKYRYDMDVRMQKRQELALGDEIVVGHIGRMSYQKNHEFVIDVFVELLKQCDNMVLLLIGVGEKENKIREKVNRLNIQSNVRFLGNRSDVAGLYQAMDVFLLPSLFEGIPLVGVEAQFANLPCFFSDRVPKEVEFSDRAAFLSLESGAEKWAEEISSRVREGAPREQENPSFENSGYNIQMAYQKLEQYYMDYEV